MILNIILSPSSILSVSFRGGEENKSTLQALMASYKGENSKSCEGLSQRNRQGEGKSVSEQRLKAEDP